MLIRRLRAEGKLDDRSPHPIILALGQLFMTSALVFGWLDSGADDVGVLFGVSLSDFGLGFLSGLTVTLVGVSIYLWLTAKRQGRSGERG